MDNLPEFGPDTQFISQSRGNWRAFNLFIGSAWRNTGLDPFEFTVLMNLVSRMDEHCNCYPSIDTIADECCMSRRKAFDVLKSLNSKDFIAWLPRVNQTNVYVVIGHPEMPWRDPKDGLPVHVVHPGVHDVHPTRAPRAPLPVHHVHPKLSPSEVTPIKEEEGGQPPFDPPLTFSDTEEESLKKEKVDGTRTGVVGAQRPLSGIEAGVEADAILANRPRGMPPLSAIETELARKGFPISDALDIFQLWLSNGFTHGGHPIKDWKATLQRRVLNGWLKSQKQNGTTPSFTPPTEAEVLAWALAKHPRWPKSYVKWCYQWFVGKNWKYYGDQITSAQWQALMETDLQKEAPR